jgi:hypothetical protein
MIDLKPPLELNGLRNGMSAWLVKSGVPMVPIKTTIHLMGFSGPKHFQAGKVGEFYGPDEVFTTEESAYRAANIYCQEWMETHMKQMTGVIALLRQIRSKLETQIIPQSEIVRQIPDSVKCSSRSSISHYTCSLLRHHAGPHIARGDPDIEHARWWDDDPPEPSQPTGENSEEQS